jgi:hypothetical protein
MQHAFIPFHIGDLPAPPDESNLAQANQDYSLKQ